MRISDWSSDVCSSDLIRTHSSTCCRTSAFPPGSANTCPCCPTPAAKSTPPATAPYPQRSTPGSAPTAHTCAGNRRSGLRPPTPRANRSRRGSTPPSPARHLGVNSPPCRANPPPQKPPKPHLGSDEHTSELQSLMRNSYAVSCFKNNNNNQRQSTHI